MAATINRWKLGLFVMLTLVLSLVVLVWLGASRLERAAVQAKYFFDEDVSGLEEGSPVKFRGVTIGKVVQIRAAPDRRHVEVSADIFLDALQQLGLTADGRPEGPQPGDELPDELRAQLIRSPLTGIAFIQTDFFDRERYPVPEYPFDVPWNTLHTVPSTGVSIEQGLVALSSELPKLVDGASRLVDRLDQLADQADVAELSVRMQKLLETVDRRLANLENEPLLVQTTATLTEAEAALAELHALAAELRAEDGPLHELTRQYASLGKRMEGELAAADLPGTSAAVQRTTDELGLLGHDVRRDLRTLWTTLASLRRLTDLLERDPGALLRGKVVPASATDGSNR